MAPPFSSHDMQIPIDQIIEPENYQYDEDEFTKLKESIKGLGLLHAITVKGNGPYEVVTGRARFLCVKELELPNIEALVFNGQDAHIIALHENLRRHNLPWYESVELEKELHELRVSQHGEKRGGRPTPNQKGWSQNDTARELGLSLGGFSQDMALATELKRNPSLKNVKDKTTALKLIKNITKRQTAEILQSLPNEEVDNSILLGDSAEVLKGFSDNLFDIIITDPPWSEYRDEELTANPNDLLAVFREVYRVMARDSIMFAITSTPDFYFYVKELPKIGFKVQSYPIIWQKINHVSHGLTSWQTVRNYEPILLAVKGDPSLTTGIVISSIMAYEVMHYTKMIHPHEKPIVLIKNLLNLGSHAGAKVLDPFAGSGVVLEAAQKYDRQFIGIEKSKAYFDKIQERLKNGQQNA